MDDKLTFYRILQFLSFTSNCHFKQEILNEELVEVENKEV